MLHGRLTDPAAAEPGRLVVSRLAGTSADSPHPSVCTALLRARLAGGLDDTGRSATGAGRFVQLQKERILRFAVNIRLGP